MEVITTDIVIVGAGGGGLRSAIAIAQQNPDLEVALISKVYPMRSHTVAAEGGAAGVVQDHDSLEDHFHDTVSGGDWLCDQDTVQYFVENAKEELVQLEHWGCPWSRKDDGHVNVRAFGGMKIERTWFAADKSGFHILHTLFQTSLQYKSIKRYDEYFTTDLLVEDGRCQGVVAIEIATGIMRLFIGKAVILATGGAGRVFRSNTNGAIVTGDGMGMAFRAGVPLQDMEFIQYHPTCLPGTGILMTEACRGEGGILVNKDNYRFLQDYGLGPVDPWPRNKAMELGPRDRLSQAIWHEQQKGRTIKTATGEDVVHLDLRHLGAKKLQERLPFICELARDFVGVDPVTAPIPVKPAVHYTMGGVKTDLTTTSPLPGLFAVGECASSGLHGANRLGSNSLTELMVLGKQGGKYASEYARNVEVTNAAAIETQANSCEQRIKALVNRSEGSERISTIRKEMALTMEEGAGIYRTAKTMQATCDKLNELKERVKRVKLDDTSAVFNTELFLAIELEAMLETATSIAHSALNRKESRGSHQRIDGFEERDDVNYLKHSLAYYNSDGDPRIEYDDVTITTSQPAERVYGGAAEDHGK